MGGALPRRLRHRVFFSHFPHMYKNLQRFLVLIVAVIEEIFNDFVGLYSFAKDGHPPQGGGTGAVTDFVSEPKEVIRHKLFIERYLQQQSISFDRNPICSIFFKRGCGFGKTAKTNIHLAPRDVGILLLYSFRRLK